MAEQDRKAGCRGEESESGVERRRAGRRVAGERPREKERRRDDEWTTKKVEEERVYSNSARTTDNSIYRCIGAAGSAATKTLTE